MSRLLPLTMVPVLAACVTPAPLGISDDGSDVPLNQRVHVGNLTAMPESVAEDSRCPQNARCIWAGRLVVRTRVDGRGWHETVPLALGTRYDTHGTWIALISGRPEETAGANTALIDYRFAYEGGV